MRRWLMRLVAVEVVAALGVAVGPGIEEQKLSCHKCRNLKYVTPRLSPLISAPRLKGRLYGAPRGLYGRGRRRPWQSQGELPDRGSNGMGDGWGRPMRCRRELFPLLRGTRRRGILRGVEG